MKIPASDMINFKAMVNRLKASEGGDAVRTGYAMKILIARVEELEAEKAPSVQLAAPLKDSGAV